MICMDCGGNLIFLYEGQKTRDWYYQCDSCFRYHIHYPCHYD